MVSIAGVHVAPYPNIPLLLGPRANKWLSDRSTFCLCESEIRFGSPSNTKATETISMAFAFALPIQAKPASIPRRS
jgi:hypothetical protein